MSKDATMRAYMALKKEHKRYKNKVCALLTDLSHNFACFGIIDYIETWIDTHPKEEKC